MLRTREREWLAGPPPHVGVERAKADMAVYRPLRCPGCKRPGMKAEAQHTRGGGYRLWLTCGACGATEEA